MKPVILYSFVLAALSSMALCGIAPSPGKGIRYACTNDCRNKQAGQSCGRGCTCTPNNKYGFVLICLSRGARKPYDFGGRRR
uniref:Mucin n=1 Tax=Rhipicephalus appendiculatus TaxID=34631 RepID=A0A131YR08_RHIAP